MMSLVFNRPFRARHHSLWDDPLQELAGSRRELLRRVRHAVIIMPVSTVTAVDEPALPQVCGSTPISQGPASLTSGTEACSYRSDHVLERQLQLASRDHA